MEEFEFVKIRKFVTDIFDEIKRQSGHIFTVEYKWVPASEGFASAHKKVILILYKDGQYYKDFSCIATNVYQGYSTVLSECFTHLIIHKGF